MHNAQWTVELDAPMPGLDSEQFTFGKLFVGATLIGRIAAPAYVVEELARRLSGPQEPEPESAALEPGRCCAVHSSRCTAAWGELAHICCESCPEWLFQPVDQPTEELEPVVLCAACQRPLAECMAALAAQPEPEPRALVQVAARPFQAIRLRLIAVRNRLRMRYTPRYTPVTPARYTP